MARASVEVPGVDFAVYKDGDEAVVENDRGQARIEHRGDEFQYTAVSGDPLELGHLGHGFATDAGFKRIRSGSKKLRDIGTRMQSRMFTNPSSHRG